MCLDLTLIFRGYPEQYLMAYMTSYMTFHLCNILCKGNKYTSTHPPLKYTGTCKLLSKTKLTDSLPVQVRSVTNPDN